MTDDELLNVDSLDLMRFILQCVFLNFHQRKKFNFSSLKISKTDCVRIIQILRKIIEWGPDLGWIESGFMDFISS